MNAQALVAWNLRKLRLLRKLSQEALAVDAEIDRTYVSRLERGLENPTVAVLVRLAEALNVQITEFFNELVDGSQVPTSLRKGRKPKKHV